MASVLSSTPSARRRLIRDVRPLQYAMKILKHLIVLLASAFVAVAADGKRHIEEDAIREAVFRYLFANNAAHGPATAEKKIEAYYLSIGEKDSDPTDAFMKRFAGNKPPIRKVSECSTAKMRVTDKQTGKRGLIFRVRSINRISDTEVEVKGGYYEDGLSASGNTYRVKKKGSTWQVTKDKMDWISQGLTKKRGRQERRSRGRRD